MEEGLESGDITHDDLDKQSEWCTSTKELLDECARAVLSPDS